MTQCYYRRLPGDVYESTDLTRSNWTPEIQHGSPPLALLTKVIEEQLVGPDQRIGRLSLDILGAIPVTQLQVRAWVERPGKRISLLAAEMTPADSNAPLPGSTPGHWPPPTPNAVTDRHPPLVEGPVIPLPDGWWNADGYLESVDFRRQQDDPSGSRVFWLTPKVPLVGDEPTTALQRLAMVVDSANGVGSALDPQQYLFMNTDTVVHLHRPPTGDDFALRARGSIGPDGIGVTTADVYDRGGFIGTCAQTLLVQRR